MPITAHRSEPHSSNRAPRRIVVVGSDGRLGRALVGFLEPHHQVVGVNRRQLDLGSVRSITDTLAGLDYDHLYLTSALTDVDYCETHEAEAFAVNAEGPGRIADISARKRAHVTYISTDMVFGGSKTDPYVEADAPDPVSVYGASKLAGETRVLNASAGNLVARTSWLFGPGRPAFPEWIIDKACSESNLTLPEDKICCPTYTLDLIGWLESLVTGRLDGPAAGVIHLCNSRPCSWLEWGQFCLDTARSAGLPVVAAPIAGVPVATVPAFIAKRPPNSALSTAKFTSLTGIRPRDWTEALHAFLQHRAVFPKSGLPR